MEFEELVRRSRKDGESIYQGTLLALDPGHTTGWAVFIGTDLVDCGQISTAPEDDDQDIIRRINGLIDEFDPTECIFEDYRIYKWRAAQHANSELHTTKLIGMFQVLLVQAAIPYHKQMASVAKQFAADSRLKEWGLWQPGKRHANDAIRHACHFIAFGPKEDWHKRKGPKRGKVVG